MKNICSKEINKEIRKIISPILSENGFDVIKVRNNWLHKKDVIWVFNLRAVGNYFSLVTGWPSMSLTGWLGMYYLFIPKVYKQKNTALPDEAACDLRSEINVSIDQSEFTRTLDNPPERKRTDIWWVEKDGSNLNKVIEDIKVSFLKDSIPWFKRLSNIENTWDEMQKQNDCYDKYYKLMYTAKFLRRKSEFNKYKELFLLEAKRINNKMGITPSY